jgi:hypothetical protein
MPRVLSLLRDHGIVLDADVSRDMRDRVRREAAMSRAAVRRFLARGRFARLAACLVVAFAAAVWVAVASVLLRVLVAAALLLIVIWCVWLIVGVWVGEPADPGEFGVSAWRVVLRWVRLAVAQPGAEPASPQGERTRSEAVSCRLTAEDEDLAKREREVAEREAAYAAARSSVDEAIAELLSRQERLHADAEQLERKLAGQIDAMRAVVARMAQLEQGVSARARAGSQPMSGPRPTAHADAVDPEPTVLDRPAEFDLHAARAELEADLRLEKVEQQEQVLRELEVQLRRREDQLADFVAQAQSQLNPKELLPDVS